MTVAGGLKTDNKLSMNLEVLALIDEQHHCLYSARDESTEIDFADFDFLSSDCFNEKIDARTGLRAYGERLLSRETSAKRKYDFDEGTSFLGTQEDIFLRGNASAIDNRGFERIDELRSRLEQGRDSNEFQKTKKPKTMFDDESFATPKVYTCYYCPAKFYSKIACHHDQVCHAKKSLRCPYCNNRSRSNSAFRRHMEYYHGRPRTREIFFDC